MGLMHAKRRVHMDWPIRIFYGLITAYQGLFGIFLPSSIFHQALADHAWAAAFIACLLASGALLVVDGMIGMVRYCTNIECRPMDPLIGLFGRWRHLLFLPPVFCYYVALSTVEQAGHSGAGIVYGYYITLAFCGVAVCIRDGIITNRYGMCR